MKSLVILTLLLVACYGMSLSKRQGLTNKVKEMFYHGYNAYMDHAYPADELMPLSCKGRVRGVTKSRGEIDDALGRFSLTLVDTLDTLVVFGNITEFFRAVDLVIRDVSFDNDIVVSTFETNIRILGGLLSAHALIVDDLANRHLPTHIKLHVDAYRGELLTMAIDLGDRLLKAFETKTGLPYSRINLRHGVDKTVRRNDITCTACAGTLIMEFAALSRFSGNPIYENVARRALTVIWTRRGRNSNLVGTTINITSGHWHRTDAGIGAGIDSYYEYLFKAYVMLGDETYLSVFNTHYDAIMRYLKRGPFLVDAHVHSPTTLARKFMDALQTFWPGLQVLKGDVMAAMETHRMYADVIEQHQFIPEAFFADFRPNWAQYPLRPEFVESTYFLFKATGDSVYLTVAERMVTALEKHSRVKCGFAAISDVRTMQKEDKMDSFMLAETLKYLYLIFADERQIPIDLDDYVFTTEAHLLPLTLSNRGPQVRFDENHKYQNQYLHDHSCPKHDNEIRNFLRLVHVHLPPFEAICVKYNVNLRKSGPTQSSGTVKRKSNKAPAIKITPEELDISIPGHVSFLESIGIFVQQVDGEVRLLFHGDLENSKHVEGAAFMKELLHLQNTRTASSRNTVHIDFLVAETTDDAATKKPATIKGGYAHFGPNLNDNFVIVEGAVEVSEPLLACQPLSQKYSGRIVIVKRGGCMFIEKVRNAEKAGASAVIIYDNKPSDEDALLNMTGDGVDDVSIPSVFIQHKYGRTMKSASEEKLYVQAKIYGVA